MFLFRPQQSFQQPVFQNINGNTFDTTAYVLSFQRQKMTSFSLVKVVLMTEKLASIQSVCFLPLVSMELGRKSILAELGS